MTSVVRRLTHEEVDRAFAIKDQIICEVRRPRQRMVRSDRVVLQ